MSASEMYYDKAFRCPVCDREFTSKKIKQKSIRVKARHDDLCTIYDGVDPRIYAVVVCQHCGYAAYDATFISISKKQIGLIKEHVTRYWPKVDYCDYRTEIEGVDTHLQAILCCNVMSSSKLQMGSIYLKLSWLCRNIGDDREFEYKAYASEFLEEGYINEPMSRAVIDELNLMYILGALSYQLGDHRKALRWFDAVLKVPEIKTYKKMEERIRDQWIEVKHAYRKEES